MNQLSNDATPPPLPCEKCTNNPCTCGWRYRKMSARDRERLASAVLGVRLFTIQTNTAIPRVHPMVENHTWTIRSPESGPYRPAPRHVFHTVEAAIAAVGSQVLGEWMTIEPPYRLLTASETLQEGDQFLNIRKEWVPANTWRGEKIGEAGAGQYRRGISSERELKDRIGELEKIVFEQSELSKTLEIRTKERDEARTALALAQEVNSTLFKERQDLAKWQEAELSKPAH